MAIKGRQSLYSIFVNGAIPTQNDYRDLIDSALNRRDDHFFGEWQKGMKYCVGDVVVYSKALYKLIEKEVDQVCPPPDDETGTEQSDGCYCSLIEPPLDELNWCVLELDLKDKDWEIVCEPEGDPDGIASTIYQLTAQVGIGTNDPKSLLDLTNQNKILLEPNDSGSPDITLQKNQTGEFGDTSVINYVKYRLTEEVCWESDALAYVFKLVTEDTPTTEEELNTNAKTTASSTAPLLLMKVTKNEDNVPQVGIGTGSPNAGLHVVEEGRGQVMLNPFQHNEPSILVVNLELDSNGYYHLLGATNEYAFQSTNATQGFRFKKDDNDKDGLMNKESAADGTDLMAILGDGRVGIGTVDPKSNLEITDGENGSGSIRVQLGNDDKGLSNPSVSINNLRPNIQQPNTYLTLGVDDNYGILISDAPSGIAVKRGGPFGTNDNEVNINQGRGVFFIAPDGKTGIKTNKPPQDYDLDVKGNVRSATAYLETNSSTILKTKDLKGENIIEQVCKLRPIRYTWLPDALKDEEEQIGFMAENVFEVIPELVKRTGTEKAIAYGNMTAVLVQAIQDQQAMMKDMEERICELEAKLGIGD